MSKIVLFCSVLLFVMASFSAKAQMADRLAEHPTLHDSAMNNAVNVTREMTNRLHLNEGQYRQLLPLNRTKLVGIKNINSEYKNNEATRAAKTAELEAQYEQECSRILTPSQLSQLQHGQPAPAPATSGNGLG